MRSVLSALARARTLGQTFSSLVKEVSVKTLTGPMKGCHGTWAKHFPQCWDLGKLTVAF